MKSFQLRVHLKTIEARTILIRFCIEVVSKQTKVLHQFPANFFLIKMSLEFEEINWKKIKFFGFNR